MVLKTGNGSTAYPDIHNHIFHLEFLCRYTKVQNGLLKRKNISTYVTGSNANLLSRDVATEFRGRGEIITVSPLSLAEFAQTMPQARDFFQIRDTYLTFGGLPECALLETEAEKRQYLDNLNATS